MLKKQIKFAQQSNNEIKQFIKINLNYCLNNAAAERKSLKYRKMQQSKFGLPVTATGSTHNNKIIKDARNEDHYIMFK